MESCLKSLYSLDDPNVWELCPTHCLCHRLDWEDRKCPTSRVVHKYCLPWATEAVSSSTTTKFVPTTRTTQSTTTRRTTRPVSTRSAVTASLLTAAVTTTTTTTTNISQGLVMCFYIPIL